MKLELKKWVKVVIYLIVFTLLIITIKDMLTKRIEVNEEGKHYTCYGSIIQVCSGENYDVE